MNPEIAFFGKSIVENVDVVGVDQRGTAGSRPIDCALPTWDGDGHTAWRLHNACATRATPDYLISGTIASPRNKLLIKATPVTRL